MLPFQWAVVGAGPAGIAAVGMLLDRNVPASAILWIDPFFSVGDFGTLWCQVSSNTKVKYFNQFLHYCPSFNYRSQQAHFSLSQLDPESTCLLEEMAKPLQWVTQHFRQKVVSVSTLVQRIGLSNCLWTLHTDTSTYQAKHVILAQGARPMALSYPKPTIPFECAIDKNLLKNKLDLSKTYAVFGGSHSAIIIVRHLVELGVKKIINFYRHPCRYALETEHGILFDNTGLKGETAAWAQTHIDGILPANLVRYKTSESNIAQFLPECEQVIYAVGFEPRNNLIIEGYEDASYNPHVGIIAPRLFGLGIAYPELKTDFFGNTELQVGLWKFMVYLDKVLPLWLKYP